MSVNNKAIFILGFVGLVFSFGDLEIGYEVGKTIWLQWWVRILTISLWLSVLQTKLKINFTPLSKKVFIFLLLFFVTVLVAAVLGVDWRQSLWGNYYRGDGLLTWSHLIILSLLVRFLLKDTVEKIFPLASFLAGALLMVKILFFGSMSSLTIGFGNPNIEAGFFVVITPLIMYFFRKFNIWIRIIVFLLIMMTVGYLQAWGAVVSLGLLAVMYWWLGIPRLKRWVVFIPLVFLIIGVTGLIWWQPVDNSKFTESRLRIFHKLGKAIWQRPVLGWGWANVDQAFDSVDWPIAVDDDVYVDKAHSELLEFAVVSGLLGLSIYLLFLSGVYKEVVSSSKINDEWGQTLLLVCLVYFFHSQTNVVSVAENTVFWVSIGLLLD